MNQPQYPTIPGPHGGGGSNNAPMGSGSEPPNTGSNPNVNWPKSGGPHGGGGSPNAPMPVSPDNIPPEEGRPSGVSTSVPGKMRYPSMK